MNYQLHCWICGRDYSPDEVRYTCPIDGPLAVLEATIDFASVQWEPPDVTAPRTMWRYRSLLPAAAAEPALAPGWTPMLAPERLRAELGLPRLWLKDETRNPTGSLKDRASALCMSKAREIGAAAVSCASTGNAAASWAAVA
ncbi:MAG: pyridoxal-phosphate dependent enzyme, partial [Chloroflexi bacterium]|nr:pyridoxal-phosphate dependent enzyme [Chloroflexota bacterium]